VLDGAAPKLRERLFHSFVAPRPGGTGRGLWISRNLLEEHGSELIARAAERGSATVTMQRGWADQSVKIWYSERSTWPVSWLKKAS
jgi:K+-sensing histidine kinase KdpD